MLSFNLILYLFIYNHFASAIQDVPEETLLSEKDWMESFNFVFADSTSTSQLTTAVTEQEKISVTNKPSPIDDHLTVKIDKGDLVIDGSSSFTGLKCSFKCVINQPYVYGPVIAGFIFISSVLAAVVGLLIKKRNHKVRTYDSV